jgi:hypothetical protein
MLPPLSNIHAVKKACFADIEPAPSGSCALIGHFTFAAVDQANIGDGRLRSPEHRQSWFAQIGSHPQ